MSLQPGQAKLLDILDRVKNHALLDKVNGKPTPQPQIEIPRLVLCGAQSAGKSSIIYSLSGIRFPTGERKCTSYPIELRLRNGPSGIQVKIEPSEKSTLQEQQNMRSFNPGTISKRAQLDKKFFESVNQAMGITSKSGKFWSHVLQITVTRPEFATLDLIDLPGIVLTRSGEDQKQEDVNFVRSMIRSYMDQKWTIILAVVVAGVQLGNAEVLKWAQEFDKDGERTLGIINKPDLLKGSKEILQEFQTLAANKDPVYKFKLGWHVVQNELPGQYFVDPQELWDDESKALFGPDSAWAHLTVGQRGGPNLFTRLSTIAHRQQLRWAGEVVEQLQSHLQLCNEELGQLSKQNTPGIDVVACLKSLCERFQVLFQQSVGDRFDSVLYSKPELYLKEQLKETVKKSIQFFQDDVAAMPGITGSSIVDGHQCEQAAVVANGSHATMYTSTDAQIQIVADSLTQAWPRQFSHLVTTLSNRSHEGIIGLVAEAAVCVEHLDEESKARLVKAVQLHFKATALKQVKDDLEDLVSDVQQEMYSVDHINRQIIFQRRLPDIHHRHAHAWIDLDLGPQIFFDRLFGLQLLVCAGESCQMKLQRLVAALDATPFIKKVERNVDGLLKKVGSDTNLQATLSQGVLPVEDLKKREREQTLNGEVEFLEDIEKGLIGCLLAYPQLGLKLPYRGHKRPADEDMDEDGEGHHGGKA